MHWILDERQPGEAIRVERDEYIYGIYVSDDEVVYFDPSSKKIVATTYNDFIGNGILEIACLSLYDHAKRLQPHLTIKMARDRLGDTSYSEGLVFVFECYTGKKVPDSTHIVTW